MLVLQFSVHCDSHGTYRKYKTISTGVKTFYWKFQLRQVLLQIDAEGKKYYKCSENIENGAEEECKK